MARICLVSCVRTKLDRNAPASDLYTSALFRKAKEVARRQFDKWYILSAKYGLVRPDDLIEPYELTLTRMPKSDRAQWALVQVSQISVRISSGPAAKDWLAGGARRLLNADSDPLMLLG
jgi:hypothetical protein